MYACICHAVTTDEVAACVEAGADSLERIGEATRAGTSCRNCHDHLDDIIEERCRQCPMARLIVA